MTYRTLAAAAATAFALAACGGDAKPAADNADRNLELAPAATVDSLNDAPGGAAADVAPTLAAPAGAAAPTTPAAPKAPSGPLTLKSGSAVPVKTARTISSRTDKAGATVRTTVTRALTDANGRVVVPAGAVVTLRIDAIHESENKSDKTGVLRLSAVDMTVGGNTYPLEAAVGHVPSVLQGRKTNAGDVAKVGAGAGIGAVAGRVLGGNTKGAVIGGVIGGAVGAQRAVETKDRDVVVPEGSVITLTLRAPLVVRR